ncbi:MAG: FKBP-type peptidyl-prolyl cis-trans isomerase [Prolixibacteraceae bacterium]|nr:FKBP-type peptidyl-prolyl cis-trans isomerase [Prolixibacteraceae bacterium]MBN2650332.1 FKBP-type peptidyl-prolyl cis-trans isomerase [Prolixibacteraceae bacterium]
MAKRESKKHQKGSAGNNRKTGEDFLNKNRSKDEVFETESGLQYSIIEKTEGEKPQTNSMVTIHQRALLLNGTILEDTYRENKADEVAVNELIEGLQEGLCMMSKGSRYKFWVTADLAWGKKGTGNKIPPFAVLQFDIRLIDFY